LLVLGIALLGLAWEPFWWIGGALEIIFLVMLASQPRFQRWVDAQRKVRMVAGHRALCLQLMAKLAAGPYNRMSRLNQKIDRAIEVTRKRYADDVTGEANNAVFVQLAWLYLKALLFQQHLEAANRQCDVPQVTRQIVDLRTELANGALAQTVKESKEATLPLLEKRLQRQQQREALLISLESDLQRIEAQVDLAIEDVALPEHPDTVSATIDRVSQLLDERDASELRPTLDNIETVLGSYGSRQPGTSNQEFNL